MIDYFNFKGQLLSRQPTIFKSVGDSIESKNKCENKFRKKKYIFNKIKLNAFSVD